MDLRTVNKLIKTKELKNTEATRDKKGVYYVLHICKNNNPVPLIHSDKVQDIFDYVNDQM